MRPVTSRHLDRARARSTRRARPSEPLGASASAAGRLVDDLVRRARPRSRWTARRRTTKPGGLRGCRWRLRPASPTTSGTGTASAPALTLRLTVLPSPTFSPLPGVLVEDLAGVDLVVGLGGRGRPRSRASSSVAVASRRGSRRSRRAPDLVAAVSSVVAEAEGLGEEEQHPGRAGGGARRARRGTRPRSAAGLVVVRRRRRRRGVGAPPRPPVAATAVVAASTPVAAGIDGAGPSRARPGSGCPRGSGAGRRGGPRPTGSG